MDKLFSYTPKMVIGKIEVIEKEMREDWYYSANKSELEETARLAKACISALFTYMTLSCEKSKCSLLLLLKEFYRIVESGDYTYLQEKSIWGSKLNTFDKLKYDIGAAAYAARLLRYYYLVMEKDDYPNAVWKDVNRYTGLICEIKQFGPTVSERKSSTSNVNDKKSQKSMILFVKDLYKHLNEHYVGQDTLKKKLCLLVAQFVFMDIRSNNLLMVGPTGCGKSYLISCLRQYKGLDIPIVKLDASTLSSAGFSGNTLVSFFRTVKDVVEKEKNRSSSGKSGSRVIIYIDEIDKLISPEYDSKGQNVNSAIQGELLACLEGTEVYSGVDSNKCLFILGGCFSHLDELKKSRKHEMGIKVAEEEVFIDVNDSLREQLIQYGAEKELLGRITNIVQIGQHSRDELRSILMHDKVGMFTKMKQTYNQMGLDLEIQDDAIEGILDLVIKQNLGARSVTNIMNEICDSRYLFDMLMTDDCKKMIIHKEMLKGKEPMFVKGEETYEKESKLA